MDDDDECSRGSLEWVNRLYTAKEYVESCMCASEDILTATPVVYFNYSSQFGSALAIVLHGLFSVNFLRLNKYLP